MKQFLLSFSLFFSMAVVAQDPEILPAGKGVVYGSLNNVDAQPISVNALQQNLVNSFFEGQITGKVKEVCQSMGCWIKLEKADGTTLMVKTKDHAFFMPKDILGKTVLVAGTASLEDVTEKKRKHLAEDAGKSKKEIAAIKGSIKELHYQASGVKVLD